MRNTRGTSHEAARRYFGGTSRVYGCHRVLLGRWESNCIPKLKVLRFDGVAARNLNQLEPNGAK